MVNLSKSEIKIVSIAALSRFLLLIIARITALPVYPSFGYFFHEFIARWDANHYLFLAQNGYVSVGLEKSYIVFPPFYPLLIKFLQILIQNYEVAGFLISNLFFILGSFAFYKLLRLDYTNKLSTWIIIVLSIFPTTYFFSASYPESLFFLLICLSFFFARKQKFLHASVFAGLATLTRPFGILIWPSLILEWFLIKNKKPEDIALIFSFLVCSSTIYLSINYLLFGNFFAFQTILSSYWQKTFTFPWTGIIGSWNIALKTLNDPEFKFIVGFAEGFAATLAYILIVLNLIVKKIRIRFSYLVYFILGVVFMTSTSFVLSTPRYLLSIPPFFITLGVLTNQKIVRILWGIISISVLIYLTNLFTRGHWAF